MECRSYAPRRLRRAGGLWGVECDSNELHVDPSDVFGKRWGGGQLYSNCNYVSATESCHLEWVKTLTSESRGCLAEVVTSPSSGFYGRIAWAVGPSGVLEGCHRRFQLGIARHCRGEGSRDAAAILRVVFDELGQLVEGRSVGVGQQASNLSL